MAGSGIVLQIVLLALVSINVVLAWRNGRLSRAIQEQNRVTQLKTAQLRAKIAGSSW